MSRIKVIKPQEAAGEAKALLAGVQAKLGMTPNMMRAMANAPAALEAYLQFSGSLSKGGLSPKVREQIALAVAEANACDYCLAAHTAIGKMVGLTTEQIRDARRGSAIDSQTAAVLALASQILASRGDVSDAQLATARNAGLTDTTIAEIVANVALNVFTNYFNRLAQIDVDFPAAGPLDVAA